MTSNIGIYKISIGEYFYIGQSQSLKQREWDHLNRLKNGTHPNKFVQNVYDKHQEFKFNLIIPCEVQELNRWEQTLLDFNQGNKLCMNISKCSEAFARGLKRSKETKKKMSEAKKGQKHPQYDHTEYTFVHEEHGEITATQHELRTKYNLDQSNTSNLILGNRKSHKGWRLKAPV